MFLGFWALLEDFDRWIESYSSRELTQFEALEGIGKLDRILVKEIEDEGAAGQHQMEPFLLY
jgi:hypothetical protein